MKDLQNRMADILAGILTACDDWCANSFVCIRRSGIEELIEAARADRPSAVDVPRKTYGKQPFATRDPESEVSLTEDDPLMLTPDGETVLDEADEYCPGNAETAR